MKDDKYKAIARKMRADGYRNAAARFGPGEWVNDCAVRTVKWDDTIGWYWVPSISRSLLIRGAKQAVAARG